MIVYILLFLLHLLILYYALKLFYKHIDEPGISGVDKVKSELGRKVAGLKADKDIKPPV